jgi:hypothetical protein
VSAPAPGGDPVSAAVEFLTTHPSARVLAAGSVVRDELDRLRPVIEAALAWWADDAELETRDALDNAISDYVAARDGAT